MKFIQYGAGNVGRGFIGQLFSQSGYEVVFIDINDKVVEKLNKDRSYPVRIVSQEGKEEVIVKNVRAVNGIDIEKVSEEISDADVMATAVGVNVLPQIIKPVVKGLRRRWKKGNLKPLNIIICENLLDANKYVEKIIKKELSKEEKDIFDKTIGLVEASIGRMIPVMTAKMQEGNVLRVWVEPYCELPVDRDGFKGDIPKVKNMIPFSPFEFFIQRKLFVHNMAHAVTAYLGHISNYKFIWEAISNTNINKMVRQAMGESVKALSLKHNIPEKEIKEYADDLVYRFGNRFLGDTIERVGKDPIRKLSPNDRLVGAAKICEKYNIKPIYISIGIAAALFFNIESDPASQRIISMVENEGPEQALRKICELNEYSNIFNNVTYFYKKLKKSKDIKYLLDELYKP